MKACPLQPASLQPLPTVLPRFKLQAALPTAHPRSFYLTPMLLPLLREMPAGKVGVDVTCTALQVVTVGGWCCAVCAASAALT